MAEHYFIRSLAFDVSGQQQLVNSANPLPVTGVVGGGGSSAPPSSLLDGTATVVTAGNPVALAASTSCLRVTVTALDSNTGYILVGSSGGQSNKLWPEDSIQIEIDDLAKVFIDAENDGEGVSYLAEVA